MRFTRVATLIAIAGVSLTTGVIGCGRGDDGTPGPRAGGAAADGSSAERPRGGGAGGGSGATDGGASTGPAGGSTAGTGGSRPVEAGAGPVTHDGPQGVPADAGVRGAMPEAGPAPDLVSRPDVGAGGPPSRDGGAPVGGGGRTIVFLNFDGAMITAGRVDDAKNNVSATVGAACCSTLAGNFPAFPGGAAERKATLEVVRSYYAPFNVEIVDQRPTSGDYTMMMIGPGRLPNGAAGVAPSDCGNRSANNIGFVLAGGPIVVAHELGHTLGLDHADGPGEIMAAVSIGTLGNEAFNDECLPFQGAPRCAAQHAAACPGGGQNSYRDLLSVLGPR